ncbi:MAG: sodium:solute symporter family protein, partial [Candidatus Parabeggiatoa sp. nov. 2]
IISIVVGEAMLIGFLLEIIPKSWAFGFLPVVPIVVVSTLIIVIGTLFRFKPAG